jgi:hypothetical protein
MRERLTSSHDSSEEPGVCSNRDGRLRGVRACIVGAFRVGGQPHRLGECSRLRAACPSVARKIILAGPVIGYGRRLIGKCRERR